MKGTENQVAYAMGLLKDVNAVFDVVIEKTGNENMVDMKNRINNADAVQIITAFKNLSVIKDSCTMTADQMAVNNWKRVRAAIGVYQKVIAPQEGLERF